MNYSIIEITKTNGRLVDGTWAGRLGTGDEEPTSLVDATKAARDWEEYNRFLKEFAVVESVRTPHDPKKGPPLPYGKIFTNLIRRDKARKMKKNKPIAFKGKFRCVFTDPPKTAGDYNIVIMRNGKPFNVPSIYHNGKNWEMIERNYVTENMEAYWVEYA